jgi:nicotinamidase-related amidase
MATPCLRDKSHTAVLIMDYQNDIVSGMATHHPQLLDRTAAVLSGARLAGLPVI